MAIGGFSIPRRGRAQLAAAVAVLGASIGLAISGCSDSTPRAAPIPTDIQTRISASIFPVLHRTVGEYATFIDNAPIHVEGYGLVGYLPNTGSGDMDPRLRQLLMGYFDREGIGTRLTDTERINPDAIMNSNQVAAVEVRGVIPPLARRGTTFDLYVNAVPNSQATSLANGLLMFSDLKVIGLTLDGNDSRTIALGRGSVFLPGPLEIAGHGSDYTPPPDAQRAQRSGRVLGGGALAEDRPARLQLYLPNDRMTRIIEHAINARFPAHDQVHAAEAMDSSIIALHVPPEYAEDPMDFVELVTHLYLTVEEPGFSEHQAKEIIDALKQPNTPHRDLSLALEGLGRSILPDYVQPYYTSSDPELRFWCARAGACMRDVEGMTVLQEFIRDPSSPYRRPAMQALIQASRGVDTARATLALSTMLQSTSVEDRVLAYQALLAIRSRAVESWFVGRKYYMDLVHSDGPPLIYVTQAETPRIAFIGQMPTLPPGLLYISKDNLLTVSVDTVADSPAAPGGLAGGTGSRTNGNVLTAVSIGSGASGTGDGNAGRPADPGKPGAKPPATPDNVTLYWRPPLGAPPVRLRTSTILPYLIVRASYAPDPRTDGNYAREPFIGASYQRITEMLASLCADKLIEAQFVTEKVPDAIVNPTEAALGGRSEGSTESPPPATAPAK